MNSISLLLPLLYFLLVLGLCAYLLIRGITHTFVALFAGGALLHLIQSLGYFAMQEALGGFSANRQYFPILALLGGFGTICFAAAFITLTLFLLQAERPASGA